jgi:hypothetical protein
VSTNRLMDTMAADTKVGVIERLCRASGCIIADGSWQAVAAVVVA